MLKKLFIVLIALAILGGIFGSVAGYKLNQTYGWIPSAVVTHESLASAETRLRLVVDTARLGVDLKPYYPPESPLPAWLPWDLAGLLPKVLPREVALLGTSDFREGTYHFTLFMNEQRGGPFLPEFLNNQTNFKAATSAIQWEEPGFSLDGRGKLKAEGALPLPDGLESTILESWSMESPEDTLALNGGHLAEGVIDNRTGDIVTLIAACAPIWGTSLELLKTNPQFTAALDLLTQVTDVRLAIDLKNPDTLVIQLLIHADPAVRGRLEFMGPFILPMAATELKRTYDLTMESTYVWLEAESTYKVDMNITGVEAKLKESFLGMATATPVPEAPRSSR